MSRALALVLALAPAALAPRAAAQEPGWSRVDGPGVLVEHWAGHTATARRLASVYAEARVDVERALGLPVPPRVLAVVAPTDGEFERRVRGLVGVAPPAGALAVALPGRDTLVVREVGLQEGTTSALGPTLRHELAHLALAPASRARGHRLERWLEEGLAEVASGRRLERGEELDLAGWARFGQLPRLAERDHDLPVGAGAGSRAYLEAFAFVDWLARRAPGGAPALVARLAAGAHTDEVVYLGAGFPTVADAELEWRLELIETHSILEALVRSVPFWSLVALGAVVAWVRLRLVRRRQWAELEAADRADAARAAAEPGPAPPAPPGEAAPGSGGPPPVGDLAGPPGA